jgi:tripartite-type tricarboxylate transporter receptor subunit TctC
MQEMGPVENRRRTCRWLLAAVAGASLASRAAAQAVTYPLAGKPVRLLVPLAAGGSLDVQARIISQKITEQTGANILVENKPGASMTLAAAEVMRASPDGHTLLFAASSIFAQNPHTLQHVPYDPFKDFTPISMATQGWLVLTVPASMPAKDARELIAWAKANPGKLIFGSFGVGSSSHVYAEAFAKAAGIEIVHVPYKGTADAVRDLFEGRINAYFDASPSAITNSQTGRVRMIGVAAPKRSQYMPEVPTIAEQGVPGIDLPGFVCVMGPAAMAPALVTRINAMFVQALSTPEVREAIAKGAYEAAPSTPAELAADIRKNYDRWGEMVKSIGFQKQ